MLTGFMGRAIEHGVTLVFQRAFWCSAVGSRESSAVLVMPGRYPRSDDLTMPKPPPQLPGDGPP